MRQDTYVKRNEQDFVISYLVLRRAVGILGIALPVVLIAGFYITNKNCPLPPTISHYYYTNFGTYFTGTLCAVALFLFSYNGPQDKDKYAAMLASFCALGVAFCPTNPYGDISSGCTKIILSKNDIRNAFHYGFAALFFITLAYFSLFLFTKSYNKLPTPEKRSRNKVYITCGWIIISCITTILALTIFPGLISSNNKENITIFILETIALFAFGFSWLIKGRTFITDKPKN